MEITLLNKEDKNCVRFMTVFLKVKTKIYVTHPVHITKIFLQKFVIYNTLI